MEIKRLFDAIDFQLNKFGDKPDVFAAKINQKWTLHRIRLLKEFVMFSKSKRE